MGTLPFGTDPGTAGNKPRTRDGAPFGRSARARAAGTPTAALSCLLLGPRTSITARALGTLTLHGITVLCVGVGGVRCYAAIAPTNTTSRRLEHQARA